MERQVSPIAEEIRNAICPYPQIVSAGRRTEQCNTETPAGWKHVKRRGGLSGQPWQRRLMRHRFRR
ncbi:hypothetical protein ACE3NQ_27080 [Paenibacillus terreus]|uniref:Uncharacterized protein n=1 Tax=Paenibacillus terreus TaxID=1387834 RepID=A0ABV5BFT6_9BACL